MSVSYRVKSKCDVEFRRWANYVLKQYIFWIRIMRSL
ncbi:MAG: virulence RhuM family protein [Lachnospiraceae bacterium]|nr:virulence RhuM family protein [Lachnospiraceae bacterium]